MITIDEKTDAMGGFLLSYAPAFWDREDANEIIRGAQDGFEAGANWALQDFKKSLWHDASEVPIYDKDLLACVERGCLRFILCKCFPHVPWNTYVDNMRVAKWCYIDDLLPKEATSE